MRKTAIVRIDDENRDKGKVFLLTEMPASQAEKWAERALLALMRSGIDVPDDLSKQGMAGIVSVGLRLFGGVSFQEMGPLLDELMACVQITPDPHHPEIVRRLIEEDIEEVATRIKLKAEVYKLHTNFSLADVLSTLGLVTMSADSQSTPTLPIS